MLDFPIVDSHLHIWDVNRLRYAWLAGNPGLNKNKLPADFDAARGGVEVDKIIFVQADCAPEESLREVEFVRDVADSRIRGIVACAALENGRDAARELDALAGIPLVRGVRRLIQSEPDPEFCTAQKFIDGVRMLSEYGFSFDLGICQSQLNAAARLVEACPEVNFVIDHIAKPRLREGKLEPWKSGMTRMAEFPNVWCKLSSLATEFGSPDWKMSDVRPFAEAALDIFGYERCMFGGDWPVSEQFASYEKCVGTLLEITRGASRTQLKRLFRENAEEFYRVRAIADFSAP